MKLSRGSDAIYYILLGVLAVILAIVMLGCGKKSYPAASVVTQITDSTVSHDTVIYRDRLITLPGDSVFIIDTIPMAIPCPDINYRKTAVSSSGRSTADVQISGNKIRVDCKTDSLNKKIDSLEKTITRVREYYSSMVQTRIVPVPGPVIHSWYIPSWVWWLVAANVALLAWRAKKLFL